MRQCFESAYAKINITLDVLGRRPDGYHDLRMIMQTVSLCDMLSIRVACGGNDIKTVSNLGYLPGDERNIAVKAARAFFEATKIPCDGVNIAIEKRIPVAAGLAGGSANGAAVLRALNKLYDAGLNDEQLCAIGLKIGADVPFCILGGTMLAEGVGERLTRLPDMPACSVVLVKPGFGISTARVFGSLDSGAIESHPDTSLVRRAINAGDLATIGKNMYNVLERVVSETRSDVPTVKKTLLELSALGAVMSGSGSTTFGIFADDALAAAAYKKLRRKYKDTFLAKTCTIRD
ncbi:MAG: 4-(cytidine 5'-diphospho)-2-C-methyl-D-erythritol kinase [Clostridia bacterium]